MKYIVQLLRPMHKAQSTIGLIFFLPSNDQLRIVKQIYLAHKKFEMIGKAEYPTGSF